MKRKFYELKNAPILNTNKALNTKSVESKRFHGKLSRILRLTENIKDAYLLKTVSRVLDEICETSSLIPSDDPLIQRYLSVDAVNKINEDIDRRKLELVQLRSSIECKRMFFAQEKAEKRSLSLVKLDALQLTDADNSNSTER